MNRLYDSTVMNTGEILRNRIFFLMDTVLKKGIRKQIKIIEKETRNPHIPQRLNELIIYAKRNVPYYNDYDAPAVVSHMPVINKNIIRADSDLFISSAYKKEELIKVSTSGSSGTPMTFYRNNEKRIRQIAEVIFLGRSIKYYFGMKHGFIRATSPKGRLNLFLENEIHIDPTKLTEENLEKARTYMKQMKSMIGFPSTLYEIALYCERKGDTLKDFNLVGIICTAEPLLVKQRKVIERVFGCPIQVRYATEELGLIAVQNPNENFYRVNEASFYIEILKLDSDITCNEGEEGRIVITDLESKAMPLIRYDTGDLGILKIENIDNRKIMTLSSISGRRIEMIYSPKGEKISPFSINVKMKDVKGVIKFQFIQKDEKEYLMNVIPDTLFYDEAEVRRILENILGTEASIHIQKVNSIPTLPSGKTTYIVNEYVKAVN